MKGKFVNGVLHGEGEHISNRKRTIYTGNFVSGEKHGKGKEIIRNRDKSITNVYTGFYLNGAKNGSGRLSYFDSGFDFMREKENGSQEFNKLFIDAPWIAGQPKSGGMMTKDGTTVCLPTTNNPASKFKWLCKLKRVHKEKENHIYKDKVRFYETSRRLHSFLELKKRKIFEIHRKYLNLAISQCEENYNPMSKESSFLAENEKQELRQMNKESQKLPTQSKYYNQQTMYFAPRSIM